MENSYAKHSWLYGCYADFGNSAFRRYEHTVYVTHILKTYENSPFVLRWKKLMEIVNYRKPQIDYDWENFRIINFSIFFFHIISTMSLFYLFSRSLLLLLLPLTSAMLKRLFLHQTPFVVIKFGWKLVPFSSWCISSFALFILGSELKWPVVFMRLMYSRIHHDR